MLSIAKLGSAGGASSYYERDNYYEKDSQEAVDRSEFYGSLAKEIGLKGQKVDTEQFKSLLEGVMPDGSQLGNIDKHGEVNRATGWDQTFSAPKSFSLLVQVMKEHDPEKAKLLEKAFESSVKQTLDYQEKHIIGTRLHTRDNEGQDIFSSVGTSKAVYALYKHNWSRAEDPQSHIHAVTINMTKDEFGNYKSLDSSKLFANKMFNGVMQRNFLAQELKELGLGIKNDRRTGQFEIRGVPKSMINEFSKGANKINKIADDLGLSGAKMKATIAKTSRKPKKVIVDPERKTLRDNFLSNARAKDIKTVVGIGEKISASQESVYNKNVLSIDDYTKSAVDFSIRELAERESVFGVEDIRKGALAYGIGNLSIQDIDRHIRDLSQSKELMNAGEKRDKFGNMVTKMVTTQAIYAEEKKVLKKFKQGIGALPPLANGKQIEAFKKRGAGTLGRDQKSALLNILSNKDRYMSVQGDAGTGKTFMFETLNQFIKNEKMDVDLILVGMTHKAKHELSSVTKQKNPSFSQKIAKALGFSTEKEASTLAAFLKSDVELKKSDLILIDEASMSSIKDMSKVVKKVDKTGARVLFVGDDKQFQSIQRGKIFTQLQTSGVNVARLSENFRQKGKVVKKVAAQLSQRETEKALSTLKDAKVMTEVKDFSSKQLSTILLDKFQSLGGDIKSTAIITDTHKNKTRVNHIMQSHFAKKRADVRSVSKNIYVKQNISNNQKRLSESYQHIDSIFSFKPIGEGANKIEAMQYHDIDRVDEKNNEIILKSGKVLSLSDYEKDFNVDKISLFKKEERTFNEKDPVLFTATDYKDRDFHNNETGFIDKINEKHVIIRKEDGTLLKFEKRDERLKQMDLKYAITSHSSQGGTYENVIAVMNSESMLANYNQLYVNTTRAKQAFAGITNNVEKLTKSYIENNGNKLSAVEEVEKNRDAVKLQESEKEIQRESSVNEQTIPLHSR